MDGIIIIWPNNMRTGLNGGGGNKQIGKANV